MSQISKQALIVDNNQSFPTNNAGEITPSDLRAFNVNMIDSLVNEIPYQSFTASVTNSINLLNQFSASQQPSFTALNSFTASQLTINTGVNSFTQSTNASINSLTAEVDTLQTWTGSVNAISDNGILQGYSTRLNFYGLMTASIVANVGGPIASIGLLSDTSRVSTSSFNAYTASTDSSISNLNQFSASTLGRLTNIESTTASLNTSVSNLNQFTASQISFNTSATASIIALQNFSSSLDVTYATDAELAALSASLVVSLNTKLNTSSFNDYTSSTNTTINGLSSKTGSYATTGSNTFYGNQFVNNGALQVASYNETTPLFYGPVVFQGVGTASVAYDQFVNAGNFDSLHIESNLNAGTIFQDYDGSNVNTWLSIPTNTGSNPAPQFKRGLVISGSTTLTGSLNVYGNTTITGSTTVTGSVLGNIVPLSITSNTASMDLSKGNFFTLTLVSGSSTQLAATNITPGQTINLLITQSTPLSGSLTYNSTIKFPAGNNYIPTAVSASKDIITFITFDNSTIYASAINNLL
jgi:hypothetical protein